MERSIRRTLVVTSLAAIALVASPGRARAQDTAPVGSPSTTAPAARPKPLYKNGESWPLRNFEKLDFLEPFVPLAAAGRGDVGRIVLNTGVPAAMLIASFAYEYTDKKTSLEIQRWKWVGLDDKQDNYPLLWGFMGISALTTFLPAPEDEDGYSWDLRLDRGTVFALGMGFATLEGDVLKPVFDRTRPNGRKHTGRPSGHAATAFAAMAYMSDVLRDTFRPQDEDNFGLRVFEEIGCAVPYLGAAYIALERVHGQKHYLTDVLLGGALGAFTMHLFYEWSFAREELGRGWIDTASLYYDADHKALGFCVEKSF